MITVAVSVCAGLGAIARYGVDLAVASHAHRARWIGAWPVGTFLVNVSGALILGLVVGLGAHHGFDHDAVTVLGTGFAGGYTTLSTWAVATVLLAEERERQAAVVHAVVSVAAGLLAAAAGLGLARL